MTYVIHGGYRMTTLYVSLYRRGPKEPYDTAYISGRMSGFRNSTLHMSGATRSSTPVCDAICALPLQARKALSNV